MPQSQADSIELEDPQQAGVYMVTDADLDTIAATPHPDSTRLLRTDLASCTGRYALFEALSGLLGLDDGAVRSWDDLADAFGDLSGLPAQGYVLLVTGAHALQQARPADFETLLDILDEAAALWAAAEIPFFSFIALPEPDAGGMRDEPAAATAAEDFQLRENHVELNQLLKLTGICDSGGAGKALVAAGAVRVDGHVELRKTCKIRAGQRVEAEGRQILVHAPRP